MNPKINVVNDQGVAFGGFIYVLNGLTRRPWTRRGPFETVSDELIGEAAKFAELRQLSYRQHPLKEIVEPNVELRRFLDSAEAVFNSLWANNAEKIDGFERFAHECLDMYGDDVADRIAKATQCEWPWEQVEVVPALYSGGTVVGNVVFFGFKPKPQNIFGLLHELCHVNTNRLKRELEKFLQMPTDANEITTVLLTNKLINGINADRGANIPLSSFGGYYSQMTDGLEQELVKLGDEVEGFEMLIKAIDGYLAELKVSGYFKQYGI